MNLEYGPEDPHTQDILKEFARCAARIRERFPLYPIKGDNTSEGIQKFPGYEAFCEMTPQTRFYLFICALMGAQQNQILQQTISDIAGSGLAYRNSVIQQLRKEGHTVIMKDGK